LVGGLGVGATIHYYRELAKAHEEQDRTLNIVIAHAETARVFELVQAGDRNGLAEYLSAFIRRLQAAGAEVAAIPAVTPHFCVREMTTVSPLPVINIFDPLVQELATRAVRRVAVFGTHFVMDSSLFGLIGEVQIIQARSEEAAYIHQTYVKLAQAGQGTQEQFEKLTALAYTLRQRDGAEAIILAGTDLALLFNKDNTDFPHIDCAALHIKAIMNGLLAEASV